MINTRLTSIRPYYKIESEKGTAEEAKADKNANKLDNKKKKTTDAKL